MKDIFANLYNKVISFFNQTEDQETENAKDVACNRLKLVLMQDRTNLTPMIMDRMRRELVELLSKYLELDKELLDLNFEQEDNQMALMLSIPVIRAKNEDEILAILEEEDRKRAEEEGNEEESDEEDSDEESEEDVNDDESDDGENSEEESNEEENSDSESDDEEIIIIKKEEENDEGENEEEVAEDGEDTPKSETKKKEKAKK